MIRRRHLPLKDQLEIGGRGTCHRIWGRLILRSLIYYWRTNLAVIAGVATAVAVFSGALLVGQSVRESLRSLLYQRIGSTEYVVSADHFFREDLAGSLISTSGKQGDRESCPIIYLQGVVTHEGTGIRAYNVNVYGVDDRFWRFHGTSNWKTPEIRSAMVGDSLARRLGARTGDGLLVRLETEHGIPRESLYGRRENIGRTVRLACGEILPREKLGAFALRPNQGDVYSIFVPLRGLQRDLGQQGRANAILLAPESQHVDLHTIRRSLMEKFTLQDLGAKLRPLPSGSGVAVESTRILLDASLAEAAFAAASGAGMKASGVLTYLANSIRSAGREIPYSVITAADLGQGAMENIRMIEGAPPRGAAGDTKESIWLNEWAWQDLGISLGETVEVDYYLWQEEGRLVTKTARFNLAGVVSIGGDVDAALAPDFPGIAETRSISSWDPPFPMDLRRIRPKDEEYWNRYRATPKAFVTLAVGESLWHSRFGKLTSVRIDPGTQYSSSIADQIASSYSRRKMSIVSPDLAGFSVDDVKQRGLEASRGSTDFGAYFVYFSFFLIVAAVLLAALFFRLGIEQRAREIGALQAMGFPASVLRRIFLTEGAILSVAGSFLGMFGAIGYGGLMVHGLRTWWVAAIGTRYLYLHVSLADLGWGAAAGILASVGMIAWTFRGLGRNSPRALLAGILESSLVRRQRARVFAVVASSAFLAAVLFLFGSAYEKLPEVAGFFGAGFLLLISSLSLAALYLRRSRPGTISEHGWRALFGLGVRNAMHRPGRSLLCIALIASATFIIVSVEAFRQNPESIALKPKSGTGGYPLLADSALPIVHEPNSAAGREALGIPESEVPELTQVRFVPFRKRPGDDASCLNLYAPQEPTVLGAGHSFLTEARFSFQDSLAVTPDQKQNPWLLLESSSRDGTIPAIGDANTIQYILRLAVGKEIEVRGSDGAPVRLRLVGALRDSVLQGELIISDANFLRAFPDQEGYRFFLLDVPAARADSLVRPLMERLADWGFSVESSRDRLAAYHQVENTYLSTFQSLGALGLMLGTAGLGTVLLRNVIERRRELALLRAVGYRRQALSAIVVAENVALMICGLASGTICALLAILPALHARGVPFPVAMVSLILIAVLIVGVASSLLAVIAAFRSPLLDALQSE